MTKPMYNHITAYESDDIESLLATLQVARLSRYTQADVVVYGSEQRIGVVTEVFTEATEWNDADQFDAKYLTDDGKLDGRRSSPIYLLATEDSGVEPFRASELDKMPEEEAFGTEEKESAEQYLDKLDQATLTADCPIGDQDAWEVVGEAVLTTPGLGFKSWPDSWVKADKPARLIALDAWTSMGASFRGCVREMRGNVVAPKRFCASFKDEIYGTTYWRNGGD